MIGPWMNITKLQNVALQKLTVDVTCIFIGLKLCDVVLSDLIIRLMYHKKILRA